MTAEGLEHFISVVGIPAALVFGMLFALWRLAKFFGPKVSAWFDAQTNLVCTIREEEPKRTVLMQRLTDVSDSISVSQERVEARVASMDEKHNYGEVRKTNKALVHGADALMAIADEDVGAVKTHADLMKKAAEKRQ